MVTLAGGVADSAQKRNSDEQGESREEMALKNRSAAPTKANLDTGVNLDALLTKSGKTDWSEKKGATIEGYVIQVEREEDGDYHLALASQAGETNTAKWVIVEVTPAMRKTKAALSEARLKQLNGKKVRVTGWLYYEPEENQPDPRGTRWEIHPVTDLTVVER